jgi:hypothetical protein
MGNNSSATSPNHKAYGQDDDDHRRVAPMGRTPRKPRTVEDDIFVVNAGTARANGRYKKVYLTSKTKKAQVGKKGGHLAERNGAGIYYNFHGFEISREIIDDEAGWILGKRGTQEAFYGIKDSSFLPPPKKWGSTWQFVGAAPCPTISLHYKDAVALGYDEIREQESIQKAIFENEQAKLENKKKRNLKVGTKINKKAVGTTLSTSSTETVINNGQTSTKTKKKTSKWNVVRSSMENKDDNDFLPVSPSRQRAERRRHRPPALAWKTPEKTLKKKLPKPFPSPVFSKAIEMNTNTQEERTERFTAKREERYQYYQKRLDRGGTKGSSGNHNSNSSSIKESVNRSPLSNLKNKKRTATIQFV